MEQASVERELVPPAPSRWKGIQSLDLVHRLNERCIELLREMTMAADPDATPPIVAQNRELWTGLTSEACHSLARLPFVLVDVRLQDVQWWQQVVESPSDGEALPRESRLPREASEHLMHETAMFAWQTARWDRTAARMLLGMSRSVTEVIAALTPQQIRTVAAREHHAVRIRWSDDVRFWHDLLLSAKDGDQKRLAALHLHAKLSLCSDLSQLSDERS